MGELGAGGMDVQGRDSPLATWASGTLPNLPHGSRCQVAGPDPSLIRPLLSDLARLPLEAGLRSVRRQLAAQVVPGAALEVGCGTGLLRACLGVRPWTGVDLDGPALALARRRCRPGDRVLAADAARLPFDDDAFPLVLTHGLLHHLADPAPALAEMARVCSGRLVIVDLVRDDAPTLRRALYAADAGRHIRFAADLRRLAEPVVDADVDLLFRSGLNRKLLLAGPPR